jgi:outer membrane beta-barrel protein
MNQARVGLLLAAALMASPLTAAAQPEGEPIDLDESAEGEEGADVAGGDVEGEGVEGEGVEGEGVEGEGLEGGGLEDEGGLEDICEIDPEACPSIDMEKAAARPLDIEMYAVQQIYALRRERFEINPYFLLTMNDQFVSHPGGGLAINYYLTNVLAVGINGNLYGNSNSDFNFQTSRAARVGQPLTEYQWNANANFSYVPVYGKFAGFSDFIFHYDFYVVGGVGAISTRPIAVVDPDNRSFEFEPKISFKAGGGLRIFFNRWFALMAEISDYAFFDELENPSIAQGSDPATGLPNATNPETWLAEDSEFTNNVQAQIGISVFLPFTWEYRLPK